MSRRFVTKTDIDAIADRGETRFVIDDRTTVTDLAREHAHQRGVAIVRTSAEAPTPAEAGAAVDPALRSAVRSAVIAALGSKPDGLDAALDKVLGDR